VRTLLARILVVKARIGIRCPASLGVTFALALSFAVSSRLRAQTNETFEVASVRVSPPQPPPPGASAPFPRMAGGPGTKDPEHLRYSNVSMFRLLGTLFQVQADQLVGPDWIKKEDGQPLFDIMANVPAGATRAQMNIMMQNLLKERFHLEFHREERNFDAYELVVSRSGHKLKEAEIPAEIPTVPSGPLRVSRGDDGFPILPAGSTMGQGVSNKGSMFISVDALKGFVLAPPQSSPRPGMGPTHFTLRMVTVPQLVNVVRPYLETNHVVDHTRLTGQYDIKVMFSTGAGPSGPAAAADPPGNDATEPAPDIFSAFEKQLGLKFQKTKSPLDVIVVDHIDKTPVEN
jgi:uncharacterized protein (TIGR03435 family)